MSSAAATEPIFTAVYRHGLDDKRRIQIPSKWRGAGEGLELALAIWPQSFEKSAFIMAFPITVMRGLIGKLAEKPFNDPEANAIRRFLGERSDTVMLDKAGRVCLPDELAKAIGIDREVVMVGALDRFQIWEPGRYEASKSGNDAIAGVGWSKF